MKIIRTFQDKCYLGGVFEEKKTEKKLIIAIEIKFTFYN